MRSLDLAVISLYAFAMLAIGRYYKSRVQTSDDYLLGGRTMSPLMIELSLFATLTSTLSYLAYPSAIITTDFIGRFQKEKWSQHENVRVARWASVVIGIVEVLSSLFVGQLASNLLELCFKVVKLLTAPLFVLFFLALFVPWAEPRGGVAATVASISVAVGIAFFKLGGLEFLWTGPAALVTGVVVGSAVSLIPFGSPRPSDRTS